MKNRAHVAALLMVLALAGCDQKQPTAPIIENPGITQLSLTVTGLGSVPDRYTSEVASLGTVVYTTTWGSRAAGGNVVNIWDASGATPVLVDSLVIPGANTLGDVQISSDGKLLVVATEFAPGSIYLFNLQVPFHPQPLTSFTSAETEPGVHTVKLSVIGNRTIAFLCIDPAKGEQARLVTVDISDPTRPQQLASIKMGRPYVHDTNIRDGILLTALWDDGVSIWDVGGAHGGSPESPALLGNFFTKGGAAHNVLRVYRNGVPTQWIIVGEEQPGSIGVSSGGDIHVVDISNITQGKEVAYFHLTDAGTHNFAMDDSAQILYAAYYNGGVVALDLSGNLSSCPDSARDSDERCDWVRTPRYLTRALGTPTLGLSTYIWGVRFDNGVLYASDMLNGLWKLLPGALNVR